MGLVKVLEEEGSIRKKEGIKQRLARVMKDDQDWNKFHIKFFQGVKTAAKFPKVLDNILL